MTAPSALQTPPGPDIVGYFERTVFPNGTELYFRESDHAYYGEVHEVKGKWCGVQASRRVGVSTVCNPFDTGGDGLKFWTEKMTLEGIVRGFNGKRVPSDPHVFRQLLEKKELRWYQIREAKADRGKAIHKQMVHALATHDRVPDLDLLPEDQRGFGQGVMRWFLDRDPEISHAEQVVGSVEHRFAGTLDLRCKIKDPLRPDFGIVDFKSSESGFVPTSVFPQPLGYDLGGLHSGLWDEPAEWNLIVYVYPNGKYREIWSPATHEDFLAGLYTYRRAAEFAKVAKAA
jgi:hypothetical protein